MTPPALLVSLSTTPPNTKDTTVPMTLTSPSVNRKYPWELILDGHPREVDLSRFGPTASIVNFRAAASSAAKRRNLQVSVVAMAGLGDRVVWVQAYDLEGNLLIPGILSMRDELLV